MRAIADVPTTVTVKSSTLARLRAYKTPGATLDDVLEVEERPNMPGTTDAWPNWSIALPEPLEELERRPLAGRLAELLRRSTDAG